MAIRIYVLFEMTLGLAARNGIDDISIIGKKIFLVAVKVALFK